MRNKLQVIDVTVLSSYMGKFQTAIVAVMVLAITASALITNGGLDAGRGLLLGVPDRGSIEATTGYYEPLRLIVQEVVGRPVRVAPGIPADADLVLLTPTDLDGAPPGNRLEPILGFAASPTGADQAVLIAAKPMGPAELERLTLADVVFTGGGSLNGQWVQLHHLEQKGALDSAAGEMATLGTPEDPSAVIFAVVFGRFTVGACRQSDVDRLLRSEALAPGAVHVVDRYPAVPEWILATRRNVGRKHGEKFARIADRFSAGTPSTPPDAHAELMRSRGLAGAAPINDRTASAIESVLAYRGRRVSRTP